jgi:ribosome-binding factor A
VFVSVLGGEDAREGSLAALARAHGLLQGRIASQLSLKRTPRLEFVYDPTTDRALRVESLIREQQ